MSSALFSSVWYRVAAVKPRLLSHAHIYRHYYRGQQWYVLQDKVAGRYHRFSPSVYYLISLMDGQRSLQQIWEEAVGHDGEEAPTQDETIQLMGQLHNAGVLASDVTPDTRDLYQKYNRQRSKQASQKLLSPLSIKIPMLDPEKFLAATLKMAAPLFSIPGFIMWLLLVGSAVVAGMLNWAPLTENIVDTVTTPANLLLLWFLFPVIKAFHELGHGYACKRWGGEVHEMGIMLLVFMPVPYVDASAASAFRERYKRLIVSAAGMLVELALASVALFIWLLVEPGLVKTLAYNTILIAGVSSIFFNANPLLRYDGYYMLADVLEIPNLGTRANQYLGYLIQRYLFGVRALSSPVSAPGERGWFIFYSIASFLFRCVVMISIALFVAGRFFLFGVVMAFMALGNLIVYPVVKHMIFVLSSPKLQLQRGRALVVTISMIGAACLALFALPVPHWTNAEGVLWMPEEVAVRAGTSCFIEEVVEATGSQVNLGQPLLHCTDATLEADLAIAKATLEEANTQYLAELNNNAYMASIVKDKVSLAQANLARISERLQETDILSQASGRWILVLEDDAKGRYVNKGDIVGYVIAGSYNQVKVAVTQQRVDLVRDQTRSVELLPSGVDAQRLHGRLQREVPGGSQYLPSPALGSGGGGAISVDPRDENATLAFERVFIFDVEIEGAELEPNFGRRIYVRFHHDDEPLGVQWIRGFRQLLLGEFGV